MLVVYYFTINIELNKVKQEKSKPKTKEQEILEQELEEDELYLMEEAELKMERQQREYWREQAEMERMRLYDSLSVY